MTSLVTMSSTRIHEFKGMKDNPAAISALQKRSIVFRGNAASLKPAMDSDQIKLRVRRPRILKECATRRPAAQDIGDMWLLGHTMHIMTKSVIMQERHHGY